MVRVFSGTFIQCGYYRAVRLLAVSASSVGRSAAVGEPWSFVWEEHQPDPLKQPYKRDYRTVDALGITIILYYGCDA